MLLIVFLFITIRIFLVFLVGIKKNRILNKSVLKNVFKGKLSLIVILIFYGISFGLVGGTSLITKNSQRSILKQYNENNVYQYETVGKNFQFYDDIANLEVEYWNKTQTDNSKKISISESDYLVNSIIPKILIDSDKRLAKEDNDWIEYFTSDKIEKYNKIFDKSKNEVDLNELFSDDVFNYKKNNGLQDYMGWKKSELDEAIRGYLSYYIEKKWIDNNFLIEKYDSAKSFVDYVTYLTYYSDYTNILDFIISSNFLNKLNLSYNATAYFNMSPKLSLNNGEDFEFIFLNDIDWKTGMSLASSENSINIFQSNDNFLINNVSYIEGENLNDKEDGFRKQSNLFNNSPNLNFQNYNVNVQEDYLRANNLKVGDKIRFGPNTEFTIVNSVRFNEVTYPSIGPNVLPDEKKQSFIQMNLSDFLMFYKKSNYNSAYNRKISYFIGDKGLYKDLTSIDKWLSIRPPNYDNRISEINKDEENNRHYYAQYDLDLEEDISKLSNRYEEKNINTQKWLDSTKQPINQNSDGRYQGTSFTSKNIKSISSLSTMESLRALMGSIESQATEGLLNLISGIFMVVVLIVISMLISKRINSLGKQLGTLKAIGMNNKNISSSYIIFPLIIIGLGFIISSLVSPIVMIILKGIMSKYYYISFSSFPLSFKYFLLLLIFPLILSISISYFISLKTLKKPTLDLLTNKKKDYPNIFVRSFGYISHKKMPFSFSYMSKGLLRALGKSSLLFISIFFSTMLTSFAMSTTTMIKHQTENALKYLNFDSMQITKTENKGAFNVQKMYDENGQLVYKDRLIKYKEETNKEILDIYKNIDINYLKNSKTISLENFESSYKEIRNLVMNPIDEAMDKNIFLIEDWKINGNKDNSIIDKDVMSSIFFSESILKFMYSKIPNNDLSFYQWEENVIHNDGLSKATYYKMNWITNEWLISLGSNFIKNGEAFKIPDFSNLNTFNLENFMNVLEEFIRNVYTNSSDVSFGTIYYNQFNQVMIDVLKIKPMQKAINDKFHFDFEDSKNKGVLPDYSTINLNVVPNEEGFKNLLGSKTNISDNLWSLFDPYVNNGEVVETNFIPLIATTQSITSLNDMVKKGFAEKHSNDVYTISTSFDIHERDIEGKSAETIYLKTNIKIVGSLFMGADFGFFTTQEFIEKYLENYNYDEIKNQFEKGENFFKVYDKNGNYEYDILGNTYNNAFNLNLNYIYNIKNPKILPPINSVNDGEGNSSLSISAKDYLFDYLINISDSPISFTLGQLLDNINENINNEENLLGKLYSNLYSNKGYPLKLDMILEQASKAYEMIITLFIIISFFAIFMSTTLILISMKDIIDSSKREISMLKAFGYSNTKSTSLIMIPYLFIILLAFILSFPLTFVILEIIAKALTIVTGHFFFFTLDMTQVLILMSFIFGFSGFLMLMAYISFKNTNALDTISETDE